MTSAQTQQLLKCITSETLLLLLRRKWRIKRGRL